MPKTKKKTQRKVWKREWRRFYLIKYKILRIVPGSNEPYATIYYWALLSQLYTVIKSAQSVMKLTASVGEQHWRKRRLLLLLLSCISRLRLCDPVDGSPPVSAVPGILQARTLEWVAISFSNAWKWKVKVKSLSHVLLIATPWNVAYQDSPTMEFSR